MPLLEALTSRLRSRRLTAEEEYRSLIGRNQSPNDGDAERLIDLAGQLNLSADDIGRDIESLARSIEMKRQADGGEVAHSDFKQACKAIHEFDEETLTINNNRIAKRIDLERQKGVASSRMLRTNHAIDDLVILRKANPRLFPLTDGGEGE